jgi:hypothetical protein
VRKAFVLAIGLFACLFAAGAARAGVLFLDTFEAGGNSTDINLNYTGGRQAAGSLGTIRYSTWGGNDWQQIWSGALGIGCNGINDSGYVSPDHNFAHAHNKGGYFYIGCDLTPHWFDGGPGVLDTTGWGSLRLGEAAGSRHVFVNDGSPGFGILFRLNGGWAAFDGSTFLGSGNPGALPLGQIHVELRISDAIDNNPFDGSANAILIECFVNRSNTPFFAYTRASAYASNYLTMQAYGSKTGGDGNSFNMVQYDNLEIGTGMPPPSGTVAVLR